MKITVTKNDFKITTVFLYSSPILANKSQISILITKHRIGNRYGDITPRTFLGRTLTVAWLVIGMLLTGIVIGTIAGVVGGNDLQSNLNLSGKKVRLNNLVNYLNLRVCLLIKSGSKISYNSNSTNISIF